MKSLTKRVILSFFATAACLPVTSFANTVYQHCDYQGYRVNLPVGNYDLKDLQARGIRNDDLSSLRVSPGYEMTVYQHHHFGGRSLKFRGNDRCLVNNNFNDTISSIKVRRVNKPVPPSVGGVNGRNVNVVGFGNNQGRKLGTFRQTGRKTWIEQNARGQKTFSFTERGRDDWSVYLYDASRNVSLQLDLHRKKVGYSDSSSSRKRDIYNIISSSAKMNGWLVSNVTYKSNTGRGGFVKRGSTWHEIALPSGRSRFTFREVGRDDWSVYLQDDSRNVGIQLDLHTKKVMYSANNGPRSYLYPIIGAR